MLEEGVLGTDKVLYSELNLDIMTLFCVICYISVIPTKVYFFLIKAMQCFIKSRCLSFIIIPNNFFGEKVS